LWIGDSKLPTYSIYESPQKIHGGNGMYFDTKKRTVFSPENPSLTTLYKTLEKYAPVLGDSPLFDELVNAYEVLDYDLDDGIHEEGGEKSESIRIVR
jgi:hypothetical protein